MDFAIIQFAISDQLYLSLEYCERFTPLHLGHIEGYKFEIGFSILHNYVS